MAKLESNVEVKGPVARLRWKRQAKLTNVHKEKREFDVLIENQAFLLEMIKKIQRWDEELMKSLLDLQSRNSYLSKFTPIVGHVENFPLEQQS